MIGTELSAVARQRRLPAFLRRDAFVHENVGGFRRAGKIQGTPKMHRGAATQESAASNTYML